MFLSRPSQLSTCELQSAILPRNIGNLPSIRRFEKIMKPLTFYSDRTFLVLTLLYVLGGWGSDVDALNSSISSNNSLDFNATCVASAPCELELGKAFGDPWFRAKSGEVNFFQVCGVIWVELSMLLPA